MFATMLLVLPLVMADPRASIAKNFCGSILADCFVLTPHNNQLRHCQRNTHSSRVQPPVPPPAPQPAFPEQDPGPGWYLLYTSTCESGTTDTHTFHAQLPGGHGGWTAMASH